MSSTWWLSGPVVVTVPSGGGVSDDGGSAWWTMQQMLPSTFSRVLDDVGNLWGQNAKIWNQSIDFLINRNEKSNLINLSKIVLNIKEI